MAFIPCLNTVELVFVFDNHGREERVVVNVTNAVAWTITNMQLFAKSIVDLVIADTLNWVTNQISLNRLHLTDLTTASSPSIDWQTGTAASLPLAGAAATAPVASSAALVTTLRTLSRGRSFRGRNYWPGVGIGMMLTGDGKTVDATGRVGPQQAFVANLLSTINGTAGLKLVVVSRQAGGVPRIAGVMTNVSTIDTNNKIDTQRRRVD